MNLKKFSKNAVLASIATVLFVSCAKNNDEHVYTPEESKAIVQATMDNFYDCMKKLNDGGFADFFYNAFFKKTVNNKGKNQSWSAYLSEKFDAQHFADALQNTNGFNYQSLKGTYSWNKNKELWEKTANNNNITFNFPATKEATSNNAVFTIDQYEDFEASYKDKIYRLPVKGHAVATIDGVKVFELTIKNATYDKKTNFTMPLTANVSIYTNPFTTTIKWNRQTPENFIFNFSFSSNEGCATTLRADIKLNTSDYGNITNMKAIDNISFVATQSELRIVGNVDVKSINKIEGREITTEEINTFIRADLFKGNSKIADVKYEKEKDSGVIYFIFSDGSKEKAEKYISDFEEKITNIFKRFDKNN